jgi:hypothetical protein
MPSLAGVVVMPDAAAGSMVAAIVAGTMGIADIMAIQDGMG